MQRKEAMASSGIMPMFYIT